MSQVGSAGLASNASRATDLPTPDAIMLLGPTASGKSAIAMSLVERFEIEIISVDSALVYRGMDIGTAKPTPTELAAVPHHLINLIDPGESYSAASFVRDARQLIGEIRGRGRLPLLVGGTMLYARALATGLDDLPAADPATRAALDDEAAQLGWPAMHARLATIDPQTASRLEPGDSQRIQRALEIHALSGRPMSELIGARRAHSDAPLELLTIALEPGDRAVLHARIAARFDAPLHASTTTRLLVDLNRSIGHRQLFSGITRPLPASEREAILEAHYRPHREAIEGAVDVGVAAGKPVVHVASHSFTPILDGVEREVDIGWLYDPRRPAEAGRPISGPEAILRNAR